MSRKMSDVIRELSKMVDRFDMMPEKINESAKAPAKPTKGLRLVKSKQLD